MFVFALFNLQGTVLASASGLSHSAESLFILAQLFPFVKNFFQVFSNFFFSAFCVVLPVLRRSSGNSHIIAPILCFVKHFFHYFSLFFIFFHFFIVCSIFLRFSCISPFFLYCSDRFWLISFSASWICSFRQKIPPLSGRPAISPGCG